MQIVNSYDMVTRILQPKATYSENLITSPCHFVMDTYGNLIWAELSKTKINGNYVTDLIFEYGDIMFQDTIEILGRITHTTSFDLL